MKKIKNTYHKALTFPSLNFSIQANQTQEVSDTLASILMRNKYIVNATEEKKKIQLTGEFTVETNQKRSKIKKKDIK
jgi:hypothetical protein